MPEGPAKVRASGSTKLAVQEFFAAERRNAERIEKFNRGLSDDDDLPPYEHQEYPKAMYPLGYPQQEPIVVENLGEERQRQAEGYYITLAEQQRAREEFEADMSNFETEELDAVTAPESPKRSHAKKKPAA